MIYRTIVSERPGPHVGLIRMDRPDALNALSAGLLCELTHALGELDADESIRCVVLAGSGRAFAAGGDIREMSAKTYPQVFTQNYLAEAGRRIEQFRKPLVAAISGYAFGGGCELAMLCDIVIAADTARFAQPEVNLGIVPGLGGTQRLPRAIGKAKAMDLVLTAREMAADEAERAGLVSRVVAADALIEEALAVAATIAAKPPLATMMAKELVNAAFETTLTAGVVLERRAFHSMFALQDQSEGMAAFLEKREPAFSGS